MLISRETTLGRVMRKNKSILSQRRRERQGKQQHDERQEVSRIARMERITRMEAWGKLVDCTKQLASGISGIRGIRVVRD